MAFKEKLLAGKFVVTSEIGPPKGIETRKLLADAELIRGRVDGINVTDLQSSVMRLGSLAVCSLLKQHGFEPVFQLTCRDRNRLALQSDARITAANFCRGTVANFYEIDYSDASLNATTTDKDDPLPAGSGFLSRYPTATRKYAITDRSDYKLITVKVKW